MSKNLIDIITEDKLYPIIRCSSAQDAITAGRAMIKGGIRLLEVNIESLEMFEVIQAISKDA